MLGFLNMFLLFRKHVVAGLCCVFPVQTPSWYLTSVQLVLFVRKKSMLLEALFDLKSVLPRYIYSSSSSKPIGRAGSLVCRILYRTAYVFHSSPRT